MTNPKEREFQRAVTRQAPSKPAQKGSHETLRRGLAFFMATFVLASAGYKIAGWSWIDSVYMVTITIFGVGYGEVHPVESPGMKLLTMGLILAGCTSLVYVIGGIVQMLAEGEIERMLGIRKRSKDVDLLHDHTIICGYGRVGQMLASELEAHDQPLVILDIDATRVEQATEDGFLAVQGNAVDDETLHDVGLFRARTLATVLPDDAKNVFITLTARDLCDSIRIIARAECPTTERKLIRSGASHVVMPAAIGAIRIAQLASNDEADEKELPEARYRMVHGQPQSCLVTPTDEDSVQDEVEELAHLASDLAHSIAAKKSEVVEVD
ncbi:Inner membrane protein YbaL [Rubripirellula obstinata]|uniref:Inner membrane protein YbaL n=1 Tax=Rubripirellula obstinata TaxID=406547 RepID=A0A5B1C9U1_9BACT|nr:potassium channel family protein [Rubripirellula obstinata]KAA1257908.1 Inner membrane protein YbaL [Rubripirellula obstinata]